MAGIEKERNSWAQPSLSRDFALLSAAIIFIMVLISAWVAWITYIKHSERIDRELAKEADRIERTLESEIDSTKHLLTALGRQISLREGSDLVEIAHLLQSFSTGNQKYALWFWSDPSLHIKVSSKMGILKKPLNIADRDYVQSSLQSTWQLYIGSPIEGRASGKWVIPVAMGVSDRTGKYLGTITASIDINALSEQISHIVKREGVSFAVVSRAFVPLTVVSTSEEFSIDSLPLQQLYSRNLKENPSGMMTRGGIFGGGLYSYYQISDQHPYIIVVGYDSATSDSAIRSLLWPRLMQVGLVAAFLLSFLWLIRSRVIKPVVELSNIAGEVAVGRPYHIPKNIGPLEIEHLSSKVRMISEYISERGMVEEELRNKIHQLQHRHYRALTEIRQRSMLLAGLLSEYKKSLHHINGLAQMLKDQHYGPIENNKYRQCAADIHQTGTTLELMVRKMIALSRVDATAVLTRDEPVRLGATVEQARRFVLDTLTEQGASLPPLSDVTGLPDAILQADKLQLQQTVSYIFLYLAAQLPDMEAKEIRVQCEFMPAGRTDEALIVAFGVGAAKELELGTLSEVVLNAEQSGIDYAADDGIHAQLHLTLAQSLVEGMNITLAVHRSLEDGVWCALHFPPSRIIERGDVYAS